MIDSFGTFALLASVQAFASPTLLLVSLVALPLLAAALLPLLSSDQLARRCGGVVLLILGLAIGLLFQASPSVDAIQPVRWSFLAGSSTALNHFGIVWLARPDLQPVHAFLIVLTLVGLWTLPKSPVHRHQVAGLLGMLAMALLICVADDVTSLLTGIAGIILLLWLRMRHGDARSASADDFLRWQLGGWCCLLLGLTGLVGGLSLVRSAPHSAPSATGFLLTGDLLQIPRVCLQHPAALAVWEQWRGWALLPLLAACLLWMGSFPFQNWARKLPENLPLDVRLWISCVLTKIPLLLLSGLIAPIYLGSPELLVLWLGVPVLLGLLLTAAGFVSAPVTEDRLRSWPLLWGHQLALWLLIQTGFIATGAAPLIFALLGTASLLWIIGLSPAACGAGDVRGESTWKRVGLWIAAFMFCGMPVLAWPFSRYDQILTPLQTGTIFDTLAPLGITFATLVMVIRLIPALTVNGDSRTTEVDTSATGATP